MNKTRKQISVIRPIHKKSHRYAEYVGYLSNFRKLNK